MRFSLHQSTNNETCQHQGISRNKEKTSQDHKMAATTAFLVLACVGGAAASAHPSATVVLAMKHDGTKLAELESRVLEVSDVANKEHYGHWLKNEDLVPYLGASAEHVSAAENWLEEEAKTCKAGPLAAEISCTLVGPGDFLECAGFPSHACARTAASRWKTHAPAGIADGAFVKDQHFSFHSSGVPASKESSYAASADSSPGSVRHFANDKHGSKAGLEPVGPPNAQRDAYGIPLDQSAAPINGAAADGAPEPGLQMVWGPGTFGYLPSDLSQFYAEWNVSGVSIDDVSTYGFPGQVGGDNWYEGTLDVTYISSLGSGATTIVANTNTSASTEETTGFGYALLAFAHALATAGSEAEGALPQLPQVVSMSLGSLSFDSCQLLCQDLVASGAYSQQQCDDYLATQRQVCMLDSAEIVERVNSAFMVASARGVTLLAATGDGGSHFSFGAFPENGVNGTLGASLNAISCQHQLPTFPAESPWVLGVGGEQWDNGGSSADPVYWYAGGAGFSKRFKMPAYQTDAVTGYLNQHASARPPPSTFDASMRAYPDVVALAWGVPMVTNGTDEVSGGTSASAPAFAGIVSLLNALRGANGLPPLGFLHPRLYAAAASATSTPMFFDIVVGNTSVGGDMYDCGNGFEATAGWDATTGWGSPRWEGLVKYLTQD